MDVYLLEQRTANVPLSHEWLSAGDLACLNAMRFEKRRTDWLLGRWTAKRALASYLNLPASPQALTELEVRPAPSGAPEAFFRGQPAGVAISLSHRAGTAICAIAESGAALGCDLEVIEPRSAGFIADYLTPEEQELVATTGPEDRPKLVALIWSAKESVLKVLCVGLRMDTRDLRVEPAPVPARLSNSNEWYAFKVHFGPERVFYGWWQQAHAQLRTVAAQPSPSQPIRLTIDSEIECDMLPSVRGPA